MVEHILTERDGAYIIGLQKAVKKLEEARSSACILSEEGRSVLFVGTKKQAQNSVREETECVGTYYVNAR